MEEGHPYALALEFLELECGVPPPSSLPSLSPPRTHASTLPAVVAPSISDTPPRSVVHVHNVLVKRLGKEKEDEDQKAQEARQQKSVTRMLEYYERLPALKESYQPPPPAVAQGEEKHPTLFFKNLSRTVTSHALRGACEVFGEVTEANVVRDNRTMRSRGFAFVRFACPQSAHDALRSLEGLDLEGRRLRVEWAGRAPSLSSDSSLRTCSDFLQRRNQFLHALKGKTRKTQPPRYTRE